jgi:hypothetical protein
MASTRTTLALISVALMHAAYCASGAAEELSINSFLERYSPEAEKLIQAYSHVHMSGRVTRWRKASDPEIRDLELFQDGDSYKVNSISESGERKGATNVLVVTPGRSFELSKRGADRDYVLGFLVDKNPDFEQAQQKAWLRSSMFRAPYSFFEQPLPSLFFEFSEAGVLKVVLETEKKGGKEFVRAILKNKRPWSTDWEKDGAARWEARFLFDPLSHWALQGCQVDHWKNDGQLLATMKSTIEYGEPINGTPVPRRVSYETYNPKLEPTGGPLGGHKADLTSVEFGSMNAVTFTLKGCGFTAIDEFDAPRGGFPRIFFVANGVMFVSLILIIVLNRLSKRKTSIPP